MEHVTGAIACKHLVAKLISHHHTTGNESLTPEEFSALQEAKRMVSTRNNWTLEVAGFVLTFLTFSLIFSNINGLIMPVWCAS